MNGSEFGAVARLARRTARRQWKRTTLVVALIALPVAAAVVAAGAVRAGRISEEEYALAEFGEADARIEAWATTPQVVEWVEDRVAEHAGVDASVLTVRGAYRGRLGGDPVELVDLDLGTDLADGLLVLTEGAAPVAEDEIAVAESMVSGVGIGVGDVVDLDLGAATRSFTVSGVVRHPLFTRDRSVVVSPVAFDALAAGGDAVFTTWLVRTSQGDELARGVREGWDVVRATFRPEAPAGPQPFELRDLDYALYAALTRQEVDDLLEVAAEQGPAAAVEAAYRMHDGLVVDVPEVGVSTRAERLAWSGDELNPLSQPPIAGTLFAGLLLAEVALVAGAAYATGTRRRLRELGLMGANGATATHIRASVIGEGVVAGILGAAFGAVIGVVALAAGRDLLQRFVDRYIDGVPLGAVDVAGPMLAGLAAALVAAWLPAKTASRVPTTTALEGRMPLADPRRWVVPLGAALAGIGAFLVLVAKTAFGDRATIQASAGVVLVIGGFALLTGPMVAWAGRAADRLSATLRLVVRDAARQRTRAAAATAAIMVVLIVPVVVGSAIAKEQEHTSVRGLEAYHHVVVTVFDGSVAVLEDGVVGPASSAITDDQVAEIRDLLPWVQVAEVTMLDVLGLTEAQTHAANAGIGHGFDPHGTVAVGTPELSDALADDRIRATLTEGTPVVLGREDRPTTVTLGGATWEARELPVPTVPWAMPRILVPRSLADANEWSPQLTSMLFVADHDLTAAERRAAYLSDAPVALIEKGVVTLTQGLWLALGIVLLVVLVIVALVTSLSAAESDADLQLMVAVGATPATRRRFLGLQTAYYTWFAALLAIPLGLFLMWIAASGESWVEVGPFGSVAANDVAIPWTILGGVGVLIPATVGLATALVVRSAKTVAPRRW